MPRCKVTVVSITVFENGDWASAEWRLDISVDGQVQRWTRDGVEDNRTYNLGFFWDLPKNSCDNTVDITVGGYEADNPGFPWYDDHAVIYRQTFRVPCNAGTRTLGGDGTEGIRYELQVYLSCEEPTIVVDWGAFIKWVIEILVVRLDVTARPIYGLPSSGSESERVKRIEQERVKKIEGIDEKTALQVGIQKMAKYGWHLVQLEEGKRLIFSSRCVHCRAEKPHEKIATDSDVR